MPVVARTSESPEPERSPSPGISGDQGRADDGPRPAKKARLSVHDVQKNQVDRLLSNPDKEYKLPPGMSLTDRGIRAPRDMMKNITGSSSAAGSGEFHIYKASRRREFERVKLMEQQIRALDEQKAFYERQADRDATTDAKTAKNRAKRDKRKAARKGVGKDEPGRGGPAAPSVSKFGIAARGAPAGVLFKQPREDGASDGESGVEGDVGTTAAVADAGSVPEPLPLVGSAEVQITVHDDD